MDTCKSCFYHIKPAPGQTGILSSQLKVAACYGMPPTIHGVGTPSGPQLAPLRPNTGDDDPACALFKPKLSLQN